MKREFEKKRVINFSGGSTSALMTIILKPTADDIVLFTDTGREHKGTYKFIDDFEKHEGIYVHKATYTHKKSPGLFGMDALNHHKVYLPNRMKRICTDELKVKTAKRYLRELGVQHFESFIGFRSDEKSRVLEYKSQYVKVKPRFILNEMGIDKQQVDAYWAGKPYKLDIPRILGNCDACFLKGVPALIRIFQVAPELAEPWIRDEDEMLAKRRQNTTFIKGITYREILRIAQSQKSLFDEVGLEDLVPAFSCSCEAGI